MLHPDKLPYPLNRLTAATKLAPSGVSMNLDLRQWMGDGIKLPLSGDEAMVIRIR